MISWANPFSVGWRLRAGLLSPRVVPPHPQGLQGSHLNLSQASAQRHRRYFLLNNKALKHPHLLAPAVRDSNASPGFVVLSIPPATASPAARARPPPGAALRPPSCDRDGCRRGGGAAGGAGGQGSSSAGTVATWPVQPRELSERRHEAGLRGGGMPRAVGSAQGANPVLSHCHPLLSLPPSPTALLASRRATQPRRTRSRQSTRTR